MCTSRRYHDIGQNNNVVLSVFYSLVNLQRNRLKYVSCGFVLYFTCHPPYLLSFTSPLLQMAIISSTSNGHNLLSFTWRLSPLLQMAIISSTSNGDYLLSYTSLLHIATISSPSNGDYLLSFTWR